MKLDEETYINFTPIELWRLGVKASPRLDKLRVPPRPPGKVVDIQTYAKNGQIWVKAGTGGVSLFDGKNPRLDGLSHRADFRFAFGPLHLSFDAIRSKRRKSVCGRSRT